MLVYWVWFAELKGISLLHKHRLLEHFQDPEQLFRMSNEALRKQGVPEKECRALENKNLWKAEQILQRCSSKGIGILPVLDSAYPAKLRNTPDAPVVLYYKGSLPNWEDRPLIGMVGTRKASGYGLQVAHQLGGQIAACGGLVVSGGALGGDTAAMQGALAAGYPVVGVLGCGVDVVYPYSNRKLFSAVQKKGCLLSEYPPGTAGQPWHFPARNRIISGISNGVLVTEAPKISGALITARRASEQGRDVFVVPGNINSSTCEGSNGLLQEGAIPVFSGWDVVSAYEFLYPGKVRKQSITTLCFNEETPARVAESPVAMNKNGKISENIGRLPIDKREKSTYIELDKNQLALSQEERAVLACLTRQPQQPAEIIAKLEMSSGKVLSILTVLTVKNLVQNHPGGRVSLK